MSAHWPHRDLKRDDLYDILSIFHHRRYIDMLDKHAAGLFLKVTQLK